jgi:hypothetical protein
LKAALCRHPRSRSRHAQPGARGPDVLAEVPVSVFVVLVLFFVLFVEAFESIDQAEARG